MTDTLGEDRLLDLKVVEEWVAKADAAMEHTEHWVDDELPELEPEDLTQVRDELRRSLGREKARSTWLARLCARVRHLEAEKLEGGRGAMLEERAAALGKFLAVTFPPDMPVRELRMADVREIARVALTEP